MWKGVLEKEFAQERAASVEKDAAKRAEELREIRKAFDASKKELEKSMDVYAELGNKLAKEMKKTKTQFDKCMGNMKLELKDIERCAAEIVEQSEKGSDF